MAGDGDDTEVTIEAGGKTAHTTLGGLHRAARRAAAAAAPALGAPPPEGYILSDELEDVAHQVIASDPRFDHINGLRVGYALLYGKEPQGKGGLHVLAKAVKAPALWADLGEYDVVVQANEMAWRRLSHGARQALVAHELCHIGVNQEGKAELLEHDIEEFAWIARRYGQWHSGLEHFAEQLGLGLAEPARGKPAGQG